MMPKRREVEVSVEESKNLMRCLERHTEAERVYGAYRDALCTRYGVRGPTQFGFGGGVFTLRGFEPTEDEREAWGALVKSSSVLKYRQGQRWRLRSGNEIIVIRAMEWTGDQPHQKTYDVVSLTCQPIAGRTVAERFQEHEFIALLKDENAEEIVSG